MGRQKILFMLGTRPEAIKLAPVIIEFRKNKSIDCVVCSTGQHREMLDQVLSIFEIRVDRELNLMAENQSLSNLSAKLLERVGEVMETTQPDLVFVQGDTTTAMISALAAFYRKVPVAHVEAGLRTYDLDAPWPEEMNRRFISIIAKFHFAPTELSKKNLLLEGVEPSSISITGNTVIDSLLMAKDLVEKYNQRQPLDFVDNKRIVLVTGHRRESFGRGFHNICEAIRELAETTDCHFIYPVHLNPKVQQPVHSILGGLANVELTYPQSYLSFVDLMQRSYLILTDSGGIQEEAPSLGKPVLVMRDVTERPEAVVAGTVRLVGTSKKKIVSEVRKILDNPSEYEKMSQAHNPYGDGKASARILKIVTSYFETRNEQLQV